MRLCGVYVESVCVCVHVCVCVVCVCVCGVCARMVCLRMWCVWVCGVCVRVVCACVMYAHYGRTGKFLYGCLEACF